MSSVNVTFCLIDTTAGSGPALSFDPFEVDIGYGYMPHREGQGYGSGQYGYANRSGSGYQSRRRELEDDKLTLLEIIAYAP